MNEKDFRKFYEIKLAPHLRLHAKEGIEILNRIGVMGESLKENFEMIQRITLYLYENEKIRKDFLPMLNFYPGVFIASEERIKFISSEVKQIRKELFGTQEVPFKDGYDRAIEWLRKEAKKEADDFYKKHREEVQKNILKYIRIPIKADPLGPDVDEIITFPGTKLRKLANVINWYSQNTYFSQFSLLMFILTGIKPILPSYSIVQEISSYGGKKVELKIFRPLSQKEFSSLFKPISRYLPQRKKITIKNLEVYKFIEKRGGIPPVGKMNFWKDALKEWNKAYQNKYSSARSLRMTYLRIRQKIY